MRGVLVALQFFTFIALGALLLHQGDEKLGAAQLLLGGVTLLVYL